MKPAALLFLILTFSISLSAQKANPLYDSVLARKLGADERGMKRYVLVILKSGTNNVQDSARRAELFAGHFSNMNKLAEEGKLIIAGPLNQNTQAYRGIFIFNVPEVDEARKLVDQDPTVREKIFDVEYFGFYGSAALPEYMDADKRIRRNLP
jgi:uncharacterized protein YciI